MEKVLKQKEKVESNLQRGGGTTAKFWKPADGKNEIRIMPPWSADKPYAGQFWREVAQHWNISEEQRSPVLCPKNTPDLDGDCPICEYVEELRAHKDNVSAQEIAKNLRAKFAYFINVVDLSDPHYTASDVSAFKKSRPDADVPFEVGSPKVQVYACPQTIIDQIFSVITSNQVDITDRNRGNDIFIDKKPHKDRRKTQYTVSARLKSTESPITEDVELPALDKVGFSADYEFMTNLLEEGIKSEGLLEDFDSPMLPAAEEQEQPASGLEEEMKAALNQ